VGFLLRADEEVERVAGALLARSNDPDRAAEVSWLLGYTLAQTGRTEKAAPVVEQALARPGTSGIWIHRLRALQALLMSGTGQVNRAAQAAGQVLADAERTGDRFAAGHALHTMSLVDELRRDHAAGLRHTDRALEVIGDDPQTADLRLTLLSNRVGWLRDLDRQAEAGATVRQALTLAEAPGTPQLGVICTAAAAYYFEIGQWDDALTELEPASALLGAGYARLMMHGLAALIAGHRDDQDMAKEHIAAVPAQLVRLPGHRPASHRLLMARALAAEQAGEPREAAAVLAQCLDRDLAEDMPHRYLLLPALTRLALAGGDVATAEAAARAAADEARREPLPVKTAAVGHSRGLVDGEPAPVLAAAAYYRSTGRPLDRAQALEDAAVLQYGKGDLQAARRAFASAARLYEALDAAWDLRRADTRLSALSSS
jgi:tetratricopeptide (TPR) repeat protein